MFTVPFRGDRSDRRHVHRRHLDARQRYTVRTIGLRPVSADKTSSKVTPVSARPDPLSCLTTPSTRELVGDAESAAAHQRLVELELQVQQLREALASRQQLGAATGLLACRYHCGVEQAWRLLVRVSQDLNVKVREIARVVLDAHEGHSSPEDAELLAAVRFQLPAGHPPTTP